MGFQFPNTPALNDTYAPVGGPVFTWDGTAWKGISQGAPVTVYVSDTAPLSPAIGQLWWNSATGTMAIWYADADSAQWVQVSGQVLPTAPSDNGEYVMCNGVWRLKSQSFNLAGLTTLDIPVPVWGPSKGRLTARIWQTANNSMAMRLSIDGTTFLAGATDYFVAGFVHRSGSTPTAVAPVPVIGGSSFYLSGSGDHTQIPSAAVVDFNITRASNSDAFSYTSRANTYSSVATTLYETDLYWGFAYGSVFAGTGPLKAIRLLIAAGPRSGNMTVDWLQ